MIYQKVLFDHDLQFRETFKKWHREEDIEIKYTPKKISTGKGQVERDIQNFKVEFLIFKNVFDNHIDLLTEYIH